MKSRTRKPVTLTFIRRLTAILPDQIFERFVDERCTGIEMGLLSANMLRQLTVLHRDNRMYDPVCVGWKLGPVSDGKLTPLRGCLNNDFGRLIITKFIQPAIPEATVAVFETVCPVHSIELLAICLKSHTGRKKEVNASNLRKHHLFLGAAHAREVVSKLIINPPLGLGNTHHVIGEESVGRSLFVLTYEIDGLGERRDFWLEVRVISSHRWDVRGFYQVQRHDDLNVLIPEKSFVAVAGINWVKGFGY